MSANARGYWIVKDVWFTETGNPFIVYVKHAFPPPEAIAAWLKFAHENPNDPAVIGNRERNGSLTWGPSNAPSRNGATYSGTQVPSR
jgi:hypothetical protein